MLVILVQCLNTRLLERVLVFDVVLDRKSILHKTDVYLVNQGSTRIVMQLVCLVLMDTLLLVQVQHNVFDVDVESNQTLHKLIVNTVLLERSQEMMESVSLVL